MNGKVPAYNSDDLGSKPILNQRTFILDLGAVVVQKAQKAICSKIKKYIEKIKQLFILHARD